MAFEPGFWGDINNSLDYHLMLEADSPVDKPISLAGHSLGSPNQELSDAVTDPYVKLVGGRFKRYVRTIRVAEQTGLTFTLGFPQSYLWTPLMQRARQRGGCPVTIFAKRLCQSDSEFEHAFIYPEAYLNPPARIDAYISVDDAAPIKWQTEVNTAEELILWSIGGYLQHDNAAPLYAVAIMSEDCTECSEDTLFSDMVAVGGIGGGADPLVILTTTDRFANVTSVSNSAPVTSIGRAVATDGDQVLIGFSDTAVISTGTAGGTLFSGDRLASAPTIDSNLTVPIHGVGRYNGQWIAVGGTGAGNGYIAVSDDGITWEAVASANLPVGKAFAAIAIDEENGVFYAVGEAGAAVKGSVSAGSIILSTIALPGSPGGLITSVAVLGEDHIAVAGASNYYAESFDGGVTWVQPSIPGTATVAAVTGTRERAMVAVGTAFSQRSVLTDMNYRAMTLQNGSTITGDITALASPNRILSDDETAFNYFVGVTDDGEVVFFKPFYPNA